jgi:glycosyltransferase involved in cell wall biosynthesis
VAALTSTRRCILLVTPYPPSTGGLHGSARVVTGITRELTRRHDVVVVHPAAAGLVDPDTAGHCRAVVAYGPRSGRTPRRLRDGAALMFGRNLRSSGLRPRLLAEAVMTVLRQYEPDVVQVEGTDMGSSLSVVPSGRAHRVVSVYEAAAAQLPNPDGRQSLVLRADAWAGRRTERRALRHCDAAVVFSDRDRGRIAAAGPPRLRVATVPLGWEPPTRVAEPAGQEPPIVTFVGNFIHPPNVDAAQHLVHDILPRLRVEVPDVSVVIVGAEPPESVRCLAGGGVEVTGTVPDVGPYLERSAVVVAPVRHGGGTRVKVIEALAAGKAVVTTSIGAEGVHAPQDVLTVADGPTAVAAAVANLLRDRAARTDQARRAGEWAASNLSWAATVDRLEELYAALDAIAGRPA